ncbi:MAG TPA: hypothetical protein PKA33_07290 [Amaricoccus sp.]|uniref:hypothetical protein n=1 Tax=Amaricoccus sp. TaxID=1872485 RepID=UPI002C1E912D|nr:hypothetical protein [Amaricoccus sp.]HMQ95549.1 hypothetical protein [Amaricoccus sp.]HMR51788.1 hypothetical protein [Amaricoccus sp.]HMR59376.1 hypothetical protein [Amaricoccus sp.]HMT99158.1 hypothetical protein [Amaricoccus sp.]
MDYSAWLETELEEVLKRFSTLRLHKSPKDYVRKEYSIIKEGVSNGMIWLAPHLDRFQLGPPKSLVPSLERLAGPSTIRNKHGQAWQITEPKQLISILKALDAPYTKDLQFFHDCAEGAATSKFQFKPGHTERAVDPIERSASPESIADRLHNEIQNKLYKYLKAKLGAKSVGTEQSTGSGTLIDLVTRDSGKTIFYEIKTNAAVRTNIRQALPQLLEYAFWPSEERADELIIVSHLPLTEVAGRYLRILQERFAVPISYKQFDLRENALR